MKRVLVAPMDWGLGHATRCIPIIRELIKRNCAVYLAGNGDSSTLLRNEFPKLPFFSLPGYQPVYPAAGSMIWKMAVQLPKFMRVIRKEHREIESIIRLHQIDLVIADNRFGCWSSLIPAVFITHQRSVLLPPGFNWLKPWVNRLNSSLICRFSCCWIPDLPEPMSLAGKLGLASTKQRTYPTRFIGYLSRFDTPVPKAVRYDIVCILSGPEPQRSIFEKMIAAQLRQSGLRYFLVRGLIVSSPATQAHADSHCADFLSGDELQKLIEQSVCILARSGYSTVMDLSKLGKKAILVPTPGQTEQEYLAARMMEKKIAFAVDQRRFDLMAAWNDLKNYTGFELPADHSSFLMDALDEALSGLPSRTVVPETMVPDNTFI
jgi:UDP:flavonoid glycosyltransferase YjiC (YdhE family)